MRAAHRLVVNNWRKVELENKHLLSSPVRWAVLDYEKIDSPDCEVDIQLSAERDGTAHGIAAWFETDLYDGIGFSCAPAKEQLLYGQAFFPFEKPISMAIGDRAEIRLSARLVDGDYLWRWKTKMISNTSQRGEVVQFDQSTFFGDILDQEAIKRRERRFVPSRTREIEIGLACLAAIDGRSPLEEIAAELAARFPDCFQNEQAALDRVVDIIRRHEKI